MPSTSNHFDSNGNARMVDVTDKSMTVRVATAQAKIQMERETLDGIKNHRMKKGDVLAVARLAGIQATKHTSILIPLCHSIPIEAVDVEFSFISETELTCVVMVKTTARTGVEMEALTGCTVAALTVYDMCKSVDQSMEISEVVLLSKSGGTKGDFQRKP